MTLRVVFHELAERELNEAAAYYHEARAGLGDAFIRAVERALEGAMANPGAGRLVSRDIRRLLVERFPYALMYRVRDRELRILAIASSKRRPFFWRSRR